MTDEPNCVYPRCSCQVNLRNFEGCKEKATEYLCKCGCRFPDRLGAYGCPNCNADGGKASLTQP